MGFTPSHIGLGGEQITSRFNERRRGTSNEYHIGIDISSSRRARPFRAGVYGTVVPKLGGRWGTITVVPFHNQKSSIQYLHCSSIAVKVGEIVAPWTVLGTTGDRAPPDSGVTGYHLHLHVIESQGSPLHDSWPQNFVDPTSWDLGNPLVGRWVGRVSDGGADYSSESTLEWIIQSDALNSLISSKVIRKERFSRLGCQRRIEAHFRGRIGSRPKNIFRVDMPEGRCSEQTDCVGLEPCWSFAETSNVRLINSRTIRVYAQREIDLRKTSGALNFRSFSPESTLVQSHDRGSAGIGSVSPFGLPS